LHCASYYLISAHKINSSRCLKAFINFAALHIIIHETSRIVSACFGVIVQRYQIFPDRRYLRIVDTFYVVDRSISFCEQTVGIIRRDPAKAGGYLDSEGGFTHSMPCPCYHVIPCVNSHKTCRCPALLQQCRVLRESPRGSRKYPNC
jgi:hypothetical protein